MLEGRRVIVVGLGKSGVAAARLCLAEGARVTGTDMLPEERLSEPARALGIPIVAGGHAGLNFEQADLIVLSPGVPWRAELERAERAGVPVIGELELATSRISAPLVAVGGTNGKSTTTTLVGELLKSAGLKVFVGGNLGTPAAEAVGESFDVVVLEVSSFQLERAPTFRPRVSILLNITEDHLDRYPDFEAYAHAKGNAFVNQTSKDVAVVPFGDSECERQAQRGRGRLLRFGGRGEYAVENESIVERATGARIPLSDTQLFGAHNWQNAAAAIAAARAFEVGEDTLRTALLRFVPLPHRMALAGTIRQIRFYDDSKATNVGAAVTALLGISENQAVLIAGGRDKLGSYDPLVAALEHKGRAVVVIGEAAQRIETAIGDRLPVVHARSMDDAVQAAFRLAKPGDAVLLSPACSSFDMFDSYADRGRAFTLSVARLSSELPGGCS